MKRLLLDLGIVILFVAEYFCEQAVPSAGTSFILFIVFNPLLMFVGIAVLAAFIRGLAEQRISDTSTILWVGIIEWIGLVFASFVLTCFLDVMRHPPENFITVFGFNLFILLVPGVVVSTGVYVAARSLGASKESINS